MSIHLRICTCLLGIFVVFNQQCVNSDENSTSIAEAKCAEFFRCFGILCVPGDLAGRPGAVAVNWIGSNFGVHLPDGIDVFPSITSLTYENDEFNAFVYPKFPFSIFGVPQEATMVAGMDFSKSGLETSVLPDALFHAKYLQHLRLDLMSHSGTLSISKTVSDRPEAVHLPITWKKEVPQIPVRFEIMGTREFSLNLTTTAPLALDAETAGRLQRMGQLKFLRKLREYEKSKFIGEKAEYILRRFALGSIHFVNIPVEIEKSGNQIGLGAFRHLNTCFDFPENQLHIWRDGNDESPVSIRPLSRNLSLEFAAPDRLVAKCIYDDIVRYGDLLQEGDKILSIRDVPPARLSFWEIKDELRRTEGTLPMQIERDGEVRTIELPMPPDFAYPPEWPEPKPEFNPVDE